MRTNKTLLVLPDRPEELEPNKTPKRETHNNNNSIPSLPLSFFFLPNPKRFFFFFCNAGIFCCFSTARSWKAAAVGISLSRDGAPPGGGAGGQRRPRAFVGEKEEKKRQRGLSRARTARGAGRGNAQCMGARIQIENRWDFSRQPDIRGRGRRGETSPSGPAAKRYGREGPKNPRSVQNPSSLRLLGLPARQRAARRAGLFLMLCEVWFYRSVSDSSAPARWSPAQPGAHSLPQETFEGRSAPTQVPPYMHEGNLRTCTCPEPTPRATPGTQRAPKPSAQLLSTPSRPAVKELQANDAAAPQRLGGGALCLRLWSVRAAPPSRGADSATLLTRGRESARIREHIVGRRLQRDSESLRACGH